MYNNRIDFTLALAVIEFFARIGSIASIILLLLLFQA